MNGLNPFRVSLGALGMLALTFAINLSRNKITETLEVEIYGETQKETNRKKAVTLNNKRLTPVKSSDRKPASESSSLFPSFSKPFNGSDTESSDGESGQDNPYASQGTTFSGVASPGNKMARNNKQNSEKKNQTRPPSERERSTSAVNVKKNINSGSGLGAGLFPNEVKPSSNPAEEMGSSKSDVLLTNNIPDGTYLSQPLITLSSSNASLIKYCIGNTASSVCCDPDSGVTYTGPFQLGTTDGNYCLAAKGYTSGLASSRRNWNYVVDASSVSLILTLPQRRFFQTQQLFESNITVNSSEFGDSSLTFIQRVAASDPGTTACETLASSTGLADMETSLGFIVNFGSVTAPFEIPLLVSNQLEYGPNYLVSIIERLGSSRSPASTFNEYVCLQNTIELRDFHVEGVSASKAQAFPADGTYGFQGQLNTLGSGKALGGNGITLEHGILNIIN